MASYVCLSLASQLVSDDDVCAVEVKSGSEGFLIKMRDGRFVKCVHNNPEGGHLPDYAPQPAIVLKMEDGSDLLLPIIVCEYLQPVPIHNEQVLAIHMSIGSSTSSLCGLLVFPFVLEADRSTSVLQFSEGRDLTSDCTFDSGVAQHHAHGGSTKRPSGMYLSSG